jgi:hypothetical protein
MVWVAYDGFGLYKAGKLDPFSLPFLLLQNWLEKITDYHSFI